MRRLARPTRCTRSPATRPPLRRSSPVPSALRTDGIRSTTARRRPVSTWSPSATSTSITVPAVVACTACSIFMASSTTRTCPAATVVALDHRHPDHRPRHGAPGRSRADLLAGPREPLVLDQGRAAVGAVHVGGQADLVHQVAAGDATGRSGRPPRVSTATASIGIGLPSTSTRLERPPGPVEAVADRCRPGRRCRR